MGGKVAIGAGLLAGAVTGALLLGGLVMLTPPAAVPAATIAPASPPTTQGPSPSVGPSPGAATPGPSGPTPAASASGPASGAPGASASSPAASDAGGAFGVGQPAPSLDVSQLGGGRIDLAALRGRPVWVNFMATWCPSCRDELPLMAGFAARYSNSGLVILVIDVREDLTTVDAYAKQLGITLPVGLDLDGQAQGAWRAFALPVHFWVNTDGIVSDGALGGIGSDVMAEGLRTILPGVNVTP